MPARLSTASTASTAAGEAELAGPQAGLEPGVGLQRQ
jgi:hypothetical protein